MSTDCLPRAASPTAGSSRTLSVTGTLDASTSRRIELCRVLGIFMIVVHHISLLSEAGFEDWSNLGPFRGYVQFGLTKAATGLLSVISGFLLWSRPFEARPLGHLRKKGRTLLVPMLLCNLATALALVAASSKSNASNARYTELASLDPFTWLNALMGVTAHPVNQALHFIRDLLVCNLLALAIAPWFRRYPWPTLLLSSVIVLVDLEGQLIQRHDILILFLLGGLLAHYRADLTRLDRFAIPLLSIWLLFAAYVYVTKAYDPGGWSVKTIQLANRTMAAVAVWTLSSRISSSTLGERIASASRYTFFVFAFHMPADYVLFKVWQKVLGRETYLIYWFLSAFIVTGAAIVIFRIMERVTPGPLALVTGGRVHTK